MHTYTQTHTYAHAHTHTHSHTHTINNQATLLNLESPHLSTPPHPSSPLLSSSPPTPPLHLHSTNLPLHSVSRATTLAGAMSAYWEEVAAMAFSTEKEISTVLLVFPELALFGENYRYTDLRFLDTFVDWTCVCGYVFSPCRCSLLLLFCCIFLSTSFDLSRCCFYSSIHKNLKTPRIINSLLLTSYLRLRNFDDCTEILDLILEESNPIGLDKSINNVFFHPTYKFKDKDDQVYHCILRACMCMCMCDDIFHIYFPSLLSYLHIFSHLL